MVSAMKDKPKPGLQAPLSAASGQESDRSRPARTTSGVRKSRCVATLLAIASNLVLRSRRRNRLPGEDAVEREKDN